MASIDQRPNERSKKTWRARVRVSGIKDKTRSLDIKAEAEIWAKRVEMQLLAGEDTVPDLSSEMTLEEALDKYKEEETPNKKGSVQEGRRIDAWKAPLGEEEAVAVDASALGGIPQGTIEERGEEHREARSFLDQRVVQGCQRRVRHAVFGEPCFLAQVVD